MVYILHFLRPLCHARHYVGYANSSAALTRRLEHHRKGTGSRLMRAVTIKGIEWTVARVIEDGDRTLERKIKRQKHTSRYCPICCEEHGERAWDVEKIGRLMREREEVLV